MPFFMLHALSPVNPNRTYMLFEWSLEGILLLVVSLETEAASKPYGYINKGERDDAEESAKEGDLWYIIGKMSFMLLENRD